MRWESTRQKFQTALIWVSIAALAIGLWQIRVAVLLAFGAILIAILLRVMAAAICVWTRIPVVVSLVMATTLVLAICALAVWLFGSQLSSQFADLLKHVEAGERALQSLFESHGISLLGPTVAKQGTSLITGAIAKALSTSVQFLEAAVVLIITAVYLAAQPQLYRHGIAMLFPRAHRPLALEAIELIGRTLKLWLLGQLILMLMVGLLTLLAAFIIGLPNPAALALIAGICEVIPYLGPFLSAIPALLVALTIGMMPALWTAVAYLAIHLFEGYVSAPIVQRHFITIPPALILIGIVAVDLLFGTIGIILAAPITVAVYMAVKMIYVDDPLEEHTSSQ
jgi:predicted PurR-regulated permease PerM